MNRRDSDTAGERLGHGDLEGGLLEEVAREVRAFVGARPAPDLTEGVMRLVADAGPTARRFAFRRAVAWLWTGRVVQFRLCPAYALAASALVVLLAIWARPARTATQDSNVRAATVFVQFRLDAPGAVAVQLAGSFSNWQQPYEMHQVAPGIWTVTIPLSPGVHDYSFIVNGNRWMADPYAPAVDDGFGGLNSRLALVLPDGPRS